MKVIIHCAASKRHGAGKLRTSSGEEVVFVDTILIAQQRVKDAAHVDKLMPVLVGPRKSAEFQSQHYPHMVQADLRHQSLEARTIVGRLAALPLILVDNHDSLGHRQVVSAHHRHS